jgi:hypothetical protein
MAGTATNYDVAAIANSIGQLWYDVSIPAGGGRITLHTDGTPESVANPNAKHLGMTREGAKYLVKPTSEDFFADEFRAPIKSGLTGMEGSISAELLQVTDTEILEALSPGFGTRTTGSGYEQLTFGALTLTYASIALIFPLEADPTKFGVFQLYKARNEQGIEGGTSNKSLTGMPVLFKGYEVTSRAAADTFGTFWKQVAV